MPSNSFHYFCLPASFYEDPSPIFNFPISSPNAVRPVFCWLVIHPIKKLVGYIELDITRLWTIRTRHISVRSPRCRHGASLVTAARFKRWISSKSFSFCSNGAFPASSCATWASASFALGWENQRNIGKNDGFVIWESYENHMKHLMIWWDNDMVICDMDWYGDMICVSGLRSPGAMIHGG